MRIIAWFRAWLGYTHRARLLLPVFPFFVAASAYSLFFISREVPIVGDLADEAMGTRMNLLADTSKPGPNAPPVLFLNFDDMTSERLGDPVLVPPAIIARALAALAPGRPWAVVVDLDIGYITNDSELAAMKQALTKLAGGGTVVVLGRDTLPDAFNRPLARVRSSALDDFVAKTPGILWASVASPANADGVVRTLMPVQHYGSAGTYLPSVPLVLKLRAMEGSANQLSGIVAEGLSGVARCGSARPAELEFCTRAGPMIVMRDEPTLIEFSFRWHGYGIDPTSNTAQTNARVQVASMYPLLRPEFRPGDGFGRNSLVVVGATARRRDMHTTPVGHMPGALILANASRAWLETGPRQTSYLMGLSLVLGGTSLLSAVAWATLAAVPRRFEKGIDLVLPPLMTTIVWATFLLLGNPVSSVGLVVTAYLVTSAVIVCHNTARRPATTSETWEDPIC